MHMVYWQMYVLYIMYKIHKSCCYEPGETTFKETQS